MNYYLDFEFIEGFKKPLFGKRRHFIDLISVGIYCEDGREYYAISNEYNYKDAGEWVQKNVILPMYLSTVSGDQRNRFSVSYFHKYYGLKNSEIAAGILSFCKSGYKGHDPNAPNNIWGRGQLKFADNPKFYGYFSDYDWVLFCSLFGTMMDLPAGFPMYCIDLKQSLDEKELKLTNAIDPIRGADSSLPPECWMQGFEMTGGAKSNTKLFVDLKKHPNYPKVENAHNAAADAKWNYKLHQFLNKI